MKIGIDMDDVLAEFLSGMIEYHRLTYGSDFVKEDFKEYGLWNVLGVSRDEATQIILDFYKTPIFANLLPVPGASKALGSLSQSHELFVVTSRPIDTTAITTEWLDKYFPNLLSEIYFSSNFIKHKTTKSKGEICEDLKLDVMIEDSLEYALQCVKPNRRVYLLDNPWNQSDELGDIERVFSWEEIVGKIDRK